MRQADPSELAKLIGEIGKSSEFGSRIKQVRVEAEEDDEADAFLRVYILLENSSDLDWNKVAPLVSRIEEKVASVDDRFPSVHFADAV